MKKSRILFFCDAASGKTLPKAERAAMKALPLGLHEVGNALRFCPPFSKPLSATALQPPGRKTGACSDRKAKRTAPEIHSINKWFSRAYNPEKFRLARSVPAFLSAHGRNRFETRTERRAGTDGLYTARRPVSSCAGKASDRDSVCSHYSQSSHRKKISHRPAVHKPLLRPAEMAEKRQQGGQCSHPDSPAGMTKTVPTPALCHIPRHIRPGKDEPSASHLLRLRHPSLKSPAVTQPLPPEFTLYNKV